MVSCLFCDVITWFTAWVSHWALSGRFLTATRTMKEIQDTISLIRSPHTYLPNLLAGPVPAGSPSCYGIRLQCQVVWKLFPINVLGLPSPPTDLRTSFTLKSQLSLALRTAFSFVRFQIPSNEVISLLLPSVLTKTGIEIHRCGYTSRCSFLQKDERRERGWEAGVCEHWDLHGKNFLDWAPHEFRTFAISPAGCM